MCPLWTLPLLSYCHCHVSDTGFREKCNVKVLWSRLQPVKKVKPTLASLAYDNTSTIHDFVNYKHTSEPDETVKLQFCPGNIQRAAASKRSEGRGWCWAVHCWSFVGSVCRRGDEMWGWNLRHEADICGIVLLGWWWHGLLHSKQWCPWPHFIGGKMRNAAVSAYAWHSEVTIVCMCVCLHSL